MPRSRRKASVNLQGVLFTYKMDRLIDYRKFRFSKLNGEFAYLKLLIFWPIYGLAFMFAERFFDPPQWHPIYCRLDDYIPFNELFFIPYMLWFVYLIGAIAYTLLFNERAFRRMMHFIMITYSVTIIIYFIYPNCQELRPDEFERDNFLTRYVQSFYQFDTNTNVCPSIHVLGSVAAMLGGFDTSRFSKRWCKAISAVLCILISISTVFLKQHSVIDVIAAALLSVVAYIICYRLIPEKKAGSENKKGSKEYEKASA